MLRGKFDFRSTAEPTLPFNANEVLLYLGPHPSDNNWIKASNAAGRVGLVPITYIEMDRGLTSDDVVTFLNQAIRLSHRAHNPRSEELVEYRYRLLDPSSSIQEQVERLRNELLQVRGAAISNLMSLDTDYVSSDDLISRRGNGSTGSSVSSYYFQPKASGLPRSHVSMSIEEPNLLDLGRASSATTPADPIHSHTEIRITHDHDPTQRAVPAPPSTTRPRLAGEMIDGLRNATGLSHELSQVAIQTVLEYLVASFEEMGGPLSCLMTQLAAPCALRNYPDLIRESPDAMRLKELFAEITKYSNDDQRGWTLGEDEGTILRTIEGLNRILTQADQSISKYVMQEDHYMSVHALALLYQMEPRASVRQLLRDSFAFISMIDTAALGLLSNSVLPMELAREMQADSGSKTKLYSTANLLCILLRPGEPMPVTHYEQLGTEFIRWILEAIETPPENDARLLDTLVHLFLAYNIQFRSNDCNFAIQALSEVPNAPQLTQRVISLVNLEKDPVHDDVQFNKKPINSVFKLLIDMFSCSLTASLFYKNDVNVLIDVVIRNLTDLGPGDKRKLSNLTLIRMILRNTKYSESQHRKEDLSRAFTTVLLEDDPLSVPDQRLIREIYLEFPFLSK